MKFQVLGLGHRNYEQDEVSGHNCNFDYSKHLAQSDIIVVKDIDTGKRFGIELTLQEGECGSGWTTASFANMEKVDITTWSQPVLRPTFINDIFGDGDDVSNHVFHFSADGGDYYYPSGNYSISDDIFGPAQRGLDKPLWIFTGDSNTGKSTLASDTSRVIFETDAGIALESDMIFDIIVVGNKHSISLDIIKEMFSEREIIIVNFEK